MKDTEDRFLESLFESEPVADKGFSRQIVRRINRQLWLRRLTLPAAVVIGGAIALNPLFGLLKSLASLVTLIPVDLLQPATDAIPQFQTVLMGAALLAIGLISMRTLQD